MEVTSVPEITGGVLYPDCDEFTFTSTHDSGWRCEMFGMGESLVFHPQNNHVPNWFWRKMQYLFFGNKWIYEGKE